ncbi:DNA gyrase C-terminal beta-propeller domain-containing protein, partial [Pseudorhodoplanes sp.]|uniref:DNA gyrase C-terminal beta-propeller domain-containing protein n=1 Tax=Pseudorhodoplanes sp. TaxID=1934341 RepID=UPI002D137322
ISDYLEILRSRARIQAIVKEELAKVRDDFATPRRTEIVEQMDEVEEEDLIHREDMVVTVSHQGYIKRVPLSTYRAQRRGGKGRAGMQTRDEDFVARLFVASTHAPVLYFSSLGRVYKLKVWKLPMAAPQARGKAIINILPLQQGERITTIMPLPEDESTWDTLDVMFATTKGTVRRNKLSDFSDVRPSGIIAMKLDEGEGIVDVQICRETDDVLLTAANGQCIRFAVSDVRVFAGRSSMGVRGISMEEGDRIISMSILRHVDATAEERAAYLKRANAVRRGDEADSADADDEADAEDVGGDTIELGEQRYVEMSAAEQFVLTVTEKGMGKRTSSYEYRITNRGGKGIVAMGILEGKKGAKTIRKKTGKLVASFPVEESDQIMLVTDRGQLIRTRVEGIRIVSRSSQGVIVFDTAEDERVVSVERLSEEGDDVSNGS